MHNLFMRHPNFLSDISLPTSTCNFSVYQFVCVHILVIKYRWLSLVLEKYVIVHNWRFQFLSVVLDRPQHQPTIGYRRAKWCPFIFAMSRAQHGPNEFGFVFVYKSLKNIFFSFLCVAFCGIWHLMSPFMGYNGYLCAMWAPKIWQ